MQLRSREQRVDRGNFNYGAISVHWRNFQDDRGTEAKFMKCVVGFLKTMLSRQSELGGEEVKVVCSTPGANMIDTISQNYAL